MVKNLSNGDFFSQQFKTLYVSAGMEPKSSEQLQYPPRGELRMPV